MRLPLLLFLAACPGQKATSADAAPGPTVRPDAAPVALAPQVDAAPVAENQPPELVELSAVATDVPAGGTVALQARAVDLENDPLTFWWLASAAPVVSPAAGPATPCGAAVRRPEEPSRAIFVAPAAAGVCRVTVTVEDEEHRTAQRSLDLLVHAAGPEVGP